MSKQAMEPENEVPDRKRRSSSLSTSSPSSSSSVYGDSDEDEKVEHVSVTPKSPRPGMLVLPEPPSKTPEWSMISASPRTGPAPFVLSEGSNPHNQFPPSQNTGTEYDPSRIPSSIFSSKPSAAMDWSVASNESLFSIHMGNNSFSRDHVVSKSGELSRLDELSSPYSLSTVDEENAKETADGLQRTDSSPPAEGIRLSISAYNVSAGKEINQADGARSSASTARHSHESAVSRRSFAFPVLSNEGERTSMKAAFDSSMSKPPEETVPETEAPEVVTPKETETRWYSCLCCYPRCCC